MNKKRDYIFKQENLHMKNKFREFYKFVHHCENMPVYINCSYIVQILSTDTKVWVPFAKLMSHVSFPNYGIHINMTIIINYLENLPFWHMHKF